MAIGNTHELVHVLWRSFSHRKIAKMISVSIPTIKRWLDGEALAPEKHVDGFEYALQELRELWQPYPIEEVVPMTITLATKANPRLDRAAEMLTDLLAPGPMEIRAVMAKAQRSGIPEHVMRKAALTVGIHSYTTGFGPSRVGYWSMKEIKPGRHSVTTRGLRRLSDDKPLKKLARARRYRDDV